MQPGGPEPGSRSPRSPPMSTSKKTRGFLGLEGLAAGDGCAIFTAGAGEQDAGSTCATGGQILQRHCVQSGRHAGNATSGTASESGTLISASAPSFPVPACGRCGGNFRTHHSPCSASTGQEPLQNSSLA